MHHTHLSQFLWIFRHRSPARLLDAPSISPPVVAVPPFKTLGMTKHSSPCFCTSRTPLFSFQRTIIGAAWIGLKAYHLSAPGTLCSNHVFLLPFPVLGDL